MECLGGNGYVEEGILARHFRESPVNAIWEGSGNVMCLDVLRALSREVEAAGAVLQGLAAETSGLPGAGDAVAFIGKAFRRPDSERVARLAVERLALLAAAAALNQVSPHQAGVVRADAAGPEPRQHVRRRRSRRRRYQGFAGPGAAVNVVRRVMAGLVPAIHVFLNLLAQKGVDARTGPGMTKQN